MLLLVLAFSESLNMKKIAGANEVKNFMTLLIAVIGFSVSLIGFHIELSFTGKTIDYFKEINIFSDWVLYAAVASQFIGILLARKNYDVNGNNMTSINFSLFLSLSIVPIFAFCFNDFLGFENTKIVNYVSNNEFLLFIITINILTIGYFYDKFKNSNHKINNIYWLIPYPFVLSSSIFFSTKLMQTHNAFFAYCCIVSFLIVLFLIKTIKNKEFKNLEKKHLKLGGFLTLSWCIAIPANTFAVKILAVEFITMLKRLCQILAGVVLDYFYNKKAPNIKDVFIVLSLLSVGFILYYFRG